MMFVPKILPFAVILMLLYFTEAAKWTSGVDQTRRETKELTSTIDRKRRETSGWTSGNRREYIIQCLYDIFAYGLNSL